MVMYSIWHNKNMKLRENKEESMTNILACAHMDWDSRSQLNLSKKLCNKFDHQHVSPTSMFLDPTDWNKLPLDYVNCNIDTDFVGNRVGLGIGVCLRDDTG